MKTTGTGRVLALVVGVALGAVVLPATAQEGDAPTPAPLFLEGLDLSVPSPETFRGWPPRELAEQPYWLPWGGAAVARARIFNRPIFLVLEVGWNRAAIGMARGPLADPRVLAAVNAGFVAVRVNADQRPDVRERYLTGSWPSVAFLLPNGKPMLSTVNDAGEDRPITTGAVDAETLLFLVREAAKYWSLVPDELLRRGDAWAAGEGPPKPLLGVVDASASDKMAQWMRVNADRSDGGFGAAPKFVVPGLVEYAALRAARGDPALVDHARFSLERLVASPLYDRRDGGLHRLAAASGFARIEHEKMLGANVAFLRDASFALRQREVPGLREALRATAGFLVATLEREGGGFYLAQTADPSSDDGGAYWSGRATAVPPIDPTVLAGPNALAGAALIRVAALVGDPDLERAGLAALELVRGAAYAPGRGVQHVLAPVPSTRMYLETLADTALGFADAYESTGRREYLEAARSVVDDARAALRDPDSPALLDHREDPSPPGLLARRRQPLRANVRMARAMIRLELHGLGADYGEAAREVLGYFCGDLSGFRTHGIEAALAIEETIAQPLRIRISGPDGEPTRSLRVAALDSSWPFTLVETGDAERPAVAELVWGATSSRAETPAALREAILRLTAGEVHP